MKGLLQKLSWLESPKEEAVSTEYGSFYYYEDNPYFIMESGDSPEFEKLFQAHKDQIHGPGAIDEIYKIVETRMKNRAKYIMQSFGHDVDAEWHNGILTVYGVDRESFYRAFTSVSGIEYLINYIAGVGV